MVLWTPMAIQLSNVWCLQLHQNFNASTTSFLMCSLFKFHLLFHCNISLLFTSFFHNSWRFIHKILFFEKNLGQNFNFPKNNITSVSRYYGSNRKLKVQKVLRHLLGHLVTSFQFLPRASPVELWESRWWGWSIHWSSGLKVRVGHLSRHGNPQHSTFKKFIDGIVNECMS
jgi:hypothetical protein